MTSALTGGVCLTLPIALGAGFLGGLLGYEYEKWRTLGAARSKGVTEILAAVSDCESLWDETLPNGFTGAEKANLLAAIDVIRDTLRLRSPDFKAKVDKAQNRVAALRTCVSNLGPAPIDADEDAVERHFASAKRAIGRLG